MTRPVALIPVKPLDSAKGRLAPALSRPVRRRLVLTMLDDVLAALATSAAVADAVVVTADGEVAERARNAGATIIAEDAAHGLNAGVATGLAALARRGCARVLVLPADLPLARPAEIRELALAQAETRRPHVAMVPAADGDGTNALLIAPPGSLAPSFGDGSFLAHLGQALARQVDVSVLHLAGLAADIDRPADLDMLRNLERYAFLSEPRHIQATTAGNRTGNG